MPSTPVAAIARALAVRTAVAVSTLVLASFVGCRDDRHGQAAAGEAGGLEARKAEPSQASRPPSLGVPPGSGPSSQPAAGTVASPHGPIGAAPPGAPFSGLVKLDPSVPEDVVKRTDVLFVMARESQGGGLAGRLLAVKRFGSVEFPLRYELSQQDLMVPGLPFAGPFIVTARLDKDQDPMTRGEDDLYATFREEVVPGQEGVHLVLKTGAPKTIPAPPGTKAPGAEGPAHGSSPAPTR